MERFQNRSRSGFLLCKCSTCICLFTLSYVPQVNLGILPVCVRNTCSRHMRMRVSYMTQPRGMCISDVKFETIGYYTVLSLSPDRTSLYSEDI